MNPQLIANNTKKVVIFILRTFLLVEIGFIIMYPVLYILSISFRPAEQVQDPNVVWLPTKFTLDNIKEVWKFIDYPKVFFSTVFIDVLTAFIQTLICCVVGYGFGRFKFKFKNLLFALVIFTIIVPPQTTIISSYVQYKSFDFLGIVSAINWVFTGNLSGIKLLDNIAVIYLPALFAMGIRSGLFIFIYRQFFKGVARELEDAAYIDGCGPFLCFLRIMIPIAKPAMLTTFLFSVVWYWNDTYFATVFLDSYKTVSTALVYLNDNLRLLSTNGSVDPFTSVTLVQSGCLLAVAPLTIMYAFLQKFFTESIERSGIVG